jgi:hypothetical protein
MNIRTISLFSLIASSALSMTGCSSDTNAFEDPTVTGSQSNEIQTQTPDYNSLSLAFEKLAVEALNREGEQVTATAYVADRNNNPVPDNTAIRFETNGGDIEPQCLTTDGKCTVVWTEHDPTPTTYEAIVIAYTSGEESFTDLNDNDLYDAGEPFTDISEPFFDLNGDDIRDPGSEVFIDSDNDKEFDGPDGLFTGIPCIGDNTVCNRVSTLIWNSGSIVLSGSYANNVTLSSPLPGAIDTTTILTVTVLDTNGKPMADGTVVNLESSDGTVSPDSIDFAPLQTTFILQYKTGSTAGISETLSIKVKSPSGATTDTLFFTPVL